MDKATAKMVRVEMLRQKQRNAEAYRRETEAYRIGVRDGKAHMPSHQRLDVPDWFMKEFLREFREDYVRMAMAQNRDRLPGPIVQRVAEKVWENSRENSRAIFDFDGYIAFYLERDSSGQDTINIRLPPGNLTNTINRNYIAMQDAHARLHRRHLE